MTNLDRLTQLVLLNPKLVAEQMAIGQFCVCELDKCLNFKDCDECWINKLEREEAKC